MLSLYLIEWSKERYHFLAVKGYFLLVVACWKEVFAFVAVLFDGPFVGVIRVDLFILAFTGVLLFAFMGLLLLLAC